MMKWLLVLVFGFGALAAGLLYCWATQNAHWRALKGFPPLPLLRSLARACLSPYRRRRERRWLHRLRAALQVYSVAGASKTRLGNPHRDGGYVVLVSPGLRYNELFSYGISCDVSFELSFARSYGPQSMHLYDHTIAKLPQDHPTFVFHKEGLAASPAANMDTLEHHLHRDGRAGQTVFLKVDIEGAEYAAMLAAPDYLFRSIAQITIELHDVCPDNHRVLRLLEKLKRMYLIVHVHGNNYGGALEYCGIPVPKVLEITFVNRNAIQSFTISETVFPSEHDRPNNEMAPELDLRPFYSFLRP